VLEAVYLLASDDSEGVGGVMELVTVDLSKEPIGLV
jgi:hypothetical protein